MKKSIFLKQILQFREKPIDAHRKIPCQKVQKDWKTSDKSHTRAEIFSPHGYIFFANIPDFYALVKNR